MQTLILMQGPPGSGKSTKARELAAKLPGTRICSTDDFHFVRFKEYKRFPLSAQVLQRDEYVFQHDMLAEYHQWNKHEVYHWLLQGCNVIVDNTNIRREHVRPYLEMAQLLGVFVQVVRCEGQFQNSHAVPSIVVERMRAEMEDLLT